jgi:hypothetical protein
MGNYNRFLESAGYAEFAEFAEVAGVSSLAAAICQLYHGISPPTSLTAAIPTTVPAHHE